MKSPYSTIQKAIDEIYADFTTLPLAFKERVLAETGDLIRSVQFRHPGTADVVQRLYDSFYMDIENEKATNYFRMQRALTLDDWGRKATAIESRGGGGTL